MAYATRACAIREYSEGKDVIYIQELSDYLFTKNKRYDTNKNSLAQHVRKYLPFSRSASLVYRRDR